MSWQWFIGKKQVFDELMTKLVSFFFYNVVRKNQDIWHAISVKEGRGESFCHEFLWLLPTVKTVQAEDCLHMAIQSRVTDVSSWVTSPRVLHSLASHITVVPDVFSYVSTPPKHWPLMASIRQLKLSKRVGSKWYQMCGDLRCLWKWACIF